MPTIQYRLTIHAFADGTNEVEAKLINAVNAWLEIVEHRFAKLIGDQTRKDVQVNPSRDPAAYKGTLELTFEISSPLQHYSRFDATQLVAASGETL